MKESSIDFIVDNLLLPEYGENPKWVKDIIKQAKEMHKKEIIEAYNDGVYLAMTPSKTSEQYYKNTYENETSPN